ncbi:UDP-N-acetylmuramoyl-L-alanyl-D-glutamate--2,6-diaminopimelate ligase [Candidatus Sumerlaeota bacterium]|nr:UDP-N-acetylmuramoyl-L-alanyl-D-glutamate--2,6-diaminopimelate ligase [Candidatus Sumerlaeota bacterium]
MTSPLIQDIASYNGNDLRREGKSKKSSSRECGKTMRLGTLLRRAGLDSYLKGIDANPLVSGISDNSRHVLPGDLFVAIKGENSDGHRFLSDAVLCRASTLVVQDEIPGFPGVAMIRVPDTRVALAHIAHAFYGFPTKDKLVCGVTGTNGKTTTTYLLRSCLEAGGVPSALMGTIEYDLGSLKIKANNTTPSALQLARYFHQMTQNHLSAAVMEVSSHSVVQKRILDINFRIGIFTNLTQDHLDYHENMESYRQAKWRFFEDYILKNPEGVGVFNLDDETGRWFADLSKGCKWTYGMQSFADVFPEDYSLRPSRTRALLNARGEKIEIASALPGRFNIMNILAATAGALAAGLPLKTIADGIARLKSVPGRFELIRMGQPFSVVVDYAHTPDALERLLASACDFNPPRIITVFGCGGNRDRDKRPKMASTVARSMMRNSVDYAILTNDNPRMENPGDIAREAEGGFAGFSDFSKRYEIIMDRRMAIRRALSMAQEGDVVLIAGKGHEDYQVMGSEILRFDDRETAREILDELGYFDNYANQGEE